MFLSYRRVLFAQCVAALAFCAVGCVEPVQPTTSTTSTPAKTPAASDATATTMEGAPAATGTETASTAAPAMTALAGEIKIEGSSTVYPVSQAMAVEFSALHPDVKITVGGAGTGSGFKSFIAGQCDICDASRPISEEERKSCEEKKIEWLELQICIDGLTVVVNPQNTWANCISVEELNALWNEKSTVKTWKELNASFPDQPIKLFGPDNQSGTFDYFNEVINGKAKNSRTDYSPSTNDNILVEGVSGDQYALGYFGYAYYLENKDKLKALAIKAKGGTDCVEPSDETVLSGKYTPLSRPLFIYVNLATMKRPEVAAFVGFYLSPTGQDFVTQRKYIRLPEAIATEMNGRIAAAMK